MIPVIPDDLSSRGVTHFRGLVQKKIDAKLTYLKGQVPDDEIPTNYTPNTRLAGIVPFLVRHAGRAASGYTNIHTEQLARLHSQWKTNMINGVGQYYTGIAEAVNAGWPVWDYEARNVTSAIENMMANICDELKTRIDK